MDKGYGIRIVSVTIFVLCFVGTASATNWSVDVSGEADFTGIQDAINKATDGDIILVHSGVYYENVIVDKPVTLRGIEYPIVDAGGEGDAIRLTADGITLVGFTATNARVFLEVTAGINVISSNNTITGNNVSSNWYGIRLYDSSNNNTISGNNVSNNDLGGIGLYYSSNNNKIYINNFINNTDNVNSSKSTNIWNSPLEITYTYDGTTYESYLGNYWDDYEGTDAKGDGIGDTHYSIDSERDESDDYPLMKLFENYIFPTSAPA